MERKAIFLWADGAWDDALIRVANGLNSALPDRWRRAGADAGQHDFMLSGFANGLPVYAEFGSFK